MADSDYLFADAMEMLHEWHGDTDAIVYTYGGSSLTLDAIIGDEREEEETTEQGGRSYIRYVRWCVVKSSELPSPKMDATVVYNGETYHVTPVRKSGSFHDLRLTRTAASEIARQSYRGHR